MRTFQLNDLPTQLQTTAIDNVAFTQKLIAKQIIRDVLRTTTLNDRINKGAWKQLILSHTLPVNRDAVEGNLVEFTHAGVVILYSYHLTVPGTCIYYKEL